MGMRDELVKLLVTEKDLVTLNKQADFLIANGWTCVVRCRNCKHWREPWLVDQTYGVCRITSVHTEKGKTMDVREKLVELLGKAKHEFWCSREKCNGTEFVAGYLIANGVTVQEFCGCEYCNGLPFSQMEDFTMPNASKKDYDIVTIRFCPMCGRKLPQPPKEDA